jgi:hypothetical protein
MPTDWITLEDSPISHNFMSYNADIVSCESAENGTCCDASVISLGQDGWISVDLLVDTYSDFIFINSLNPTINTFHEFPVQIDEHAWSVRIKTPQCADASTSSYEPYFQQSDEFRDGVITLRIEENPNHATTLIERLAVISCRFE